MSVAVKYTGTFSDHSGYGSANRAFIAALHLAGVDVTTELVVQVKDRTNFGWEGELAHQLQDRTIPYKVKIIHLTPDVYEPYMEDGIYHIGHLFWETDKLPADWDKYCNKMGEIWTSSAHMINLLKQSGVKVPIYAFPQPIDITIADKDYGKYSIPHHKGYLFYAIFQWIERKNPKALVKAYWEAFEGRDDVTLLIKTWRLSYDQGEFEKIKQEIQGWKNEIRSSHYPRILISQHLLTNQGMLKLHQTGDCYVSSHRGEGWSRPMQEALLMGKTAISTARGGIYEYLRQEHYFPIDSKYVPVTETPWIKFYTVDQQWAEIDGEKLKQAMRFAYTNQIISAAKGIVAKSYIKDNFSYHKIGGMMRERLEKIYHGL
jgi:glycosyltransferase involved in cell wall biosynthesis